MYINQLGRGRRNRTLISRFGGGSPTIERCHCILVGGNRRIRTFGPHKRTSVFETGGLIHLTHISMLLEDIEDMRQGHTIYQPAWRNVQDSNLRGLLHPKSLANSHHRPLGQRSSICIISRY